MTAAPPSPILARARRRRRWIWIALALLVPLLLPWFTVNAAKAGVLRSLRGGLGRTVSADAVHFVLLPLPGVELDGLQISDAPEFGLESMVLADAARATFSWSALLRGQLAFSRIRLDGADINLVRNGAGAWNVAAFLGASRSAQPRAGAPAAPALPPSVRFPYIEWSDARVNFKLNQSKTRFYLANVRGSLARESASWRLQATFQPQRSDLSLTDTGEVTVDGRWQVDRGVAFRDQPFDLAVRLANSYLAGSSALLVGQDAGWHGIAGAQMRVRGTAHLWHLSGTYQVQALRRWDLLPPPANVAGAFAADYDPGRDLLHLIGVGDPGFQHMQLDGVAAHLFANPEVALRLQLRGYPAAHLLPLALAFKAGLPANLQASGTLDGDAALYGHPAAGLAALSGGGHFDLAQLALRAGANQFSLPAAHFVWDRKGFQLLPSPATITTSAPSGAPGATPLRLAVGLTHAGYDVRLASPALDGAAARGLGTIFGVPSHWPGTLTGAANLRLEATAPWVNFRNATVTGLAQWATAQFHPGDGTAVALKDASAVFSADSPVRLTFRTPLGKDTVAATLQFDPLRFQLQSQHLTDDAVWRLLHPAPADLLSRVFGAAAPAWITGLSGTGVVQVDDLEWQGLHTGLRLQLNAQPNRWTADALDLRLAHGSFTGKGTYTDGGYHISGTASGIDLNALNALNALNTLNSLSPTTPPSPVAGLLTGILGGTLELTRPAGSHDVAEIEASGDFEVRHGLLIASGGARSFDRLNAHFTLHQGVAALTGVKWSSGGRSFTGSGTVRLGRNFTLDLNGASGALHLAGKWPRESSHP